MSSREPNEWDEVLQSDDFVLYYGDYRSLQTGAEVSNLIIDFFIKRIVGRLPLEIRQKVLVCSSGMYSALSTNGNFKAWDEGSYAGLSDAEKRHHHVRDYLNGVYLLDFEMIIVPCHVVLDKMGRGHWLLSIIRNNVNADQNTARSEVLILDSMRNTERAVSVIRHLTNLLIEDHQKSGSQLSFGRNTITCFEVMSPQKGDDNVDCGMFLLADLEYYTKHPQIPVVHGNLNVESSYAPQEVKDHKRKECADIIRSLSTLKLRDFFLHTQAELYEMAVQGKPSTSQSVVDVTIKPEPKIEPIVKLPPASSSSIDKDLTSPSSSSSSKSMSDEINEAAKHHYTSVEKDKAAFVTRGDGKIYLFCDERPEDGGLPCMYRTHDPEKLATHKRRHTEKRCPPGFHKCALRCRLSVRQNRNPHHLETAHGVTKHRMNDIRNAINSIKCTFTHNRGRVEKKKPKKATTSKKPRKAKKSRKAKKPKKL